MRVLVTGAAGMLGREVVRELNARGHEPLPFDRRALDITDAGRVDATMSAQHPDAVLHCAAYTSVDGAESDGDTAFRVNAEGAAHVATAAARAGARFVYVSTDYVFDGAACSPYPPDAPPNPLGVYARSKLAGEQAARAAADALVVRTSWVYGRGGRTFASRALERARAGEPLHAFTDQRSGPTWVRDLALMLTLLLERNAPPGIYHASNRGETSWYDFACAALQLAGVDGVVEPVCSADVSLPAPRPRYSALDVSATELVVGPIRDWRAALSAAIEEGL